MNKAQIKGTKFVKPDAIFLPKRGRRVLNKMPTEKKRVLNKPADSKSPKRAKPKENVAPCPPLLDSQCSIASCFLFESQNGGCASQHYGGDTDGTTPLSSPMKKTPLTPQNLSLTQASSIQSSQVSPCLPQSSQVSPCLSLRQAG